MAVVDASRLRDAAVLTIACHEIVECALGAAKGTADEAHSDGLDDVMKRVMWEEYVVERRRRTIFEAEGWGDSIIDHSHLNAVTDDYERDLPRLVRWAAVNDAVPYEVYGHWQLVTIEVAHASARADAGFSPERSEIDTFLARPWSPATAAAWRSARDLLPRLYKQPDAATDDLDAQVISGAWRPISDALAEDYNVLYDRAARDQPV
ncbi:MAG TPA: hypothetical protein VHF88_09445 [Thermoleophilaceae bacterium]|nr:hypothetical protein [Thermoleophilaceae bacterium]